MGAGASAPILKYIGLDRKEEDGPVFTGTVALI